MEDLEDELSNQKSEKAWTLGGLVLVSVALVCAVICIAKMR